ncbi:MAG: acyl-CoA dehydrogenase family protein [Nocardioides sp.]
MRLIGLAEMALEHASPARPGAHGVRQAAGQPRRQPRADRRGPIAIEQARLLVLHAAWKLDSGGLRHALSEVSQIKVAVPRMATEVIDLAIQIHGGAGVSDDFPLAEAYAGARTLRLADGPDEVHRGLVARLELAKYGASR